MQFVSALVFISSICSVLSQDCYCGVENSVSRIVGGTEVSKGKYPWMAYVSITLSDSDAGCGGAIINDRYILTAAHCLDDAESVSVGVGSNNDYTENTLEPAATFFQHPHWDKSIGKDDIALIKLATPLTFSNLIRPICLPPSDMDIVGELAVAGWGLTKFTNSDTSHVLLETTLEGITNDQCTQDWEALVFPSQFCASAPGHDTCEGDSGGPIMKRSNGRIYNVGIVSFGIDNCVSQTIYTRVTSFLDWIKENTADGVYCSN